MSEAIGVILSGSTTTTAKCEIYSSADDLVEEGMLLVVVGKDRILARVDSITPYNEFYREGDPWTDVRRQKLRVPSEIARKYKVAELELLGRLTPDGLAEVTSPPNPGDEVVKIDIKADIKNIFGIDEKDGIIWFGSLYGYKDVPVPLDIENITMHMAVFGSTGSGKSYTVGYLLELLSEIPVSDATVAFPTIIIDANGDYLDYFFHFLKNGRFGSFYNVYRFVFSSSKELYKSKNVRKIAIDLDEFTSRELAELIISFRTGGTINELQVAGLEMVLKELKENYELQFNDIFVKDSLYKEFEDELDRRSGREGPIHTQTAKAIRSATEQFRREVVDKVRMVSTDGPTMSSELIEEVSSKPSLVIIDFSSDGAPGISLQIKQLVIAYLTKLLYNKFVEYKMKDEERYVFLIIEEAQNYCPNPSTYPIGYTLTRRNLSLIATQGRKFGICLCLVTQRPVFVDPIVLSMVNTFLIHRISVDDVSFVKKITGGLPKSIESKLTNLRRGNVILNGQMNILHFPILVSIIGVREIQPTVGKTNVIKTLERFKKS